MEFYSPMTSIDAGTKVTLNVLLGFPKALTTVCTTSSSAGMEDAFLNSSKTMTSVLTGVSVSFAGLNWVNQEKHKPLWYDCCCLE